MSWQLKITEEERRFDDFKIHEILYFRSKDVKEVRVKVCRSHSLRCERKKNVMSSELKIAGGERKLEDYGIQKLTFEVVKQFRIQVSDKISHFQRLRREWTRTT